MCINNGTNRVLSNTVIVLWFIILVYFDHILLYVYSRSMIISQFVIVVVLVREMQRAHIVRLLLMLCRGRKNSKFLILLNTDKWKLKIKCSNTRYDVLARLNVCARSPIPPIRTSCLLAYLPALIHLYTTFMCIVNHTELNIYIHEILRCLS